MTEHLTPEMFDALAAAFREKDAVQRRDTGVYEELAAALHVPLTQLNLLADLLDYVYDAGYFKGLDVAARQVRKLARFPHARLSGLWGPRLTNRGHPVTPWKKGGLFDERIDEAGDQ